VLFTDIVNSTEHMARVGDKAWNEWLDRHHAVVRRELASCRGREINVAGDGFFATFDGPARGVHCALAIQQSARRIGLDIRAGLHTGEVELHDDTVAGIAVHIGARVAGFANAGETLVSSTVKDLVSGSGLRFEDRGAHALKGVPGEWRLYSASG
jgi:class 3 adenylate cyclase